MNVAVKREREQLLLAYKREGDRAAREQLITALMPLVRSLAARHMGRGESLEDLVQVGSIGLIKAIDRFDPDRGVELTTYAVPTILGEIRRHFRDKAWAVHVPRGIKDLRARLGQLIDSLTAELGRSPTIEELARAAEVEEEEVIEALESDQAYTARSLSAPFGDGSGESLLELVGEQDSGFDRVEDGTLVKAGLEVLEARERRIIKLRFVDGLTQSQIAAEIGISQMHVSRLLRSALQNMRGRLEEEMGAEP